jgi:hypothetical protein
MNAKNLKAVSNLIPSGPQPLADEDLGTVSGGCGYEKKDRRTTRHSTRRTTRHSSHCFRRGLLP